MFIATICVEFYATLLACSWELSVLDVEIELFYFQYFGPSQSRFLFLESAKSCTVTETFYEPASTIS